MQNSASGHFCFSDIKPIYTKSHHSLFLERVYDFSLSIFEQITNFVLDSLFLWSVLSLPIFFHITNFNHHLKRCTHSSSNSLTFMPRKFSDFKTRFGFVPRLASCAFPGFGILVICFGLWYFCRFRLGKVRVLLYRPNQSDRISPTFQLLENGPKNPKIRTSHYF